MPQGETNCKRMKQLATLSFEYGEQITIGIQILGYILKDEVRGQGVGLQHNVENLRKL